MKLETSILKPVIHSALKLTNKRQTIPILSHLLLDGHDGFLEISATDIDIFSAVSIEKKSGKLAPL